MTYKHCMQFFIHDVNYHLIIIISIRIFVLHNVHVCLNVTNFVMLTKMINSYHLQNFLICWQSIWYLYDFSIVSIIYNIKVQCNESIYVVIDRNHWSKKKNMFCRLKIHGRTADLAESNINSHSSECVRAFYYYALWTFSTAVHSPARCTGYRIWKRCKLYAYAHALIRTIGRIKYETRCL